MRTYGNIKLSDDKKQWIISGAEPHICLKLKAIFVKIKRSATQPFKFLNTPETCHDLLWFTERYPLAISEQDASVMKRDKKKHINTINELEQILMPGYNPMPVKLNEGFEARHYQLSGVDVYMKCKRILIGDDIGLGKAEWVENDIFTPNGTKKMKDIQIGDYVIGSNGKPVKVSGVYPQGEKEMYRVHFNDGASVVVCEDHLWAVKNSVRKKRGNEPIILSVKEMLDENLEKTFKVKGYNSHRAYRFRTYYKIQNGKKQDGTYRWHIPITKPVSFKEQNVLIDPYLLGALLGDGGITNSIIFTSSDNQILETVSDKLPEGICLKKKKNSKYDYAIINKKVKVGEKNMLTEYLRHYGLFGHKSDTKFIPDEYKFNSIENRISLLQGLMDTDGYVTSNKRKINSKTQSSVIGYTTTSKRLADDVLFLIQSLGGIATVSNKIPSYTHKGEKKKGKRAYTLVINLPDICPFRLKRKVDKCMPKLKYKPYRCISNIEYVGKLEAKCIKVEAEDHLYLTENFIVTHNTLIGILSCLSPQTRPCVAVVQTHLPKQWKAQIEMFTNLTVHLIKGTKPYDLPPADIYITKYSCLAGWANVFEKGIFKSAIFDEIQELRHEGTAKYEAAMALSRNVEYCLGLSATPIYNYGNEIYNVLDIIKEKCLGDRYDFLYEWCGFNYKVVREPQALGTYLRENFLLLRRTRAEVGRELPPINKIVHTVGYNENEAKKAEDIAKQLAIKATTGAFTERGQAFRELDALIRHTTGVSKAVEVAEYVKILLENNEPIVLAGWHRECFGLGTTVLMYDGTIKNIENITVGDVLMGPDSKPRNVLSLIKGNGNLFKVTPIKGESWVCSENHILSLYHSEKKETFIKETAKEFNSLSDSQKRRRSLYRSEAVHFETKRRQKYESWLLGYWLGDGASRLNDLRVSTEDIEVVTEINKIAKRYSLKVKEYKNSLGKKCSFYCFSSGKGKWGRNKLLNLFKGDSLHRNKHIPLRYKTAPIQERKELLAGLLDSDGYVYRNAYGASFTNVNKILAEDVAYLCRSIGLAAYVIPKGKSKSGYKTKNNHFQVSISGNLSDIPMRIKRKKADKRKQRKSVLRTGLSIIPNGKGDYFGVEVDGDNLFLLSDFTVVHNCYDIWMRELKDYKPVLYTGSESPAQKEEAKRKFVSGETNLFIISLRSGIGLDGLQHRSNIVVIGELDWSPKVHDQLIGRLDREGQKEQVTAIYLVSDFGSDPLIVDMLGVKSSQSHNIINPLTAVEDQFSDESRLKLLAEKFLEKKVAEK